MIDVDLSASMINEARRRAEGRGLPVDFEVGDSQALRFGAATFGVARAFDRSSVNLV